MTSISGSSGGAKPGTAPIHYSRGQNRFDAYPEQRVAEDFTAFQESVLADRSPRKGLAYICSPLELDGENKAHRLKVGAKGRAFLPFDFDGVRDGETFDKLREYLSRYRGFGYTTARHTKESPRFRAILSVSRLMTYEESEQVSQALELRLIAHFGEGAIKFDRSVYRGEQPIYTPTKTSEVFRWEEGDPVDVAELLTDAPREKPRKSKAERPTNGAGTDDFPPSSALEIAKHCGQIKHIAETKGDVSEPLWYAGIEVFRLCTEAPDIIHEWSSGYEGYSKRETDKKIKQLEAKGVGPTTCGQFDIVNPGGCDGCLSKGFITSPIQLGDLEVEAESDSAPSMGEEFDALKKPDSAEAPDWVLELNKDHFVSSIEGRSFIFKETIDHKRRRKLIKYTTESFCLLYADAKVKVGTKHQPKSIPKGRAWLTSKHRRQFKGGVVFRPGGECQPDQYNTWRGFSVEPKQGDWSLLRAHILDNICQGDTARYSYTIGWLANAVQHPDTPAEVAYVMRGQRGVGKGVLAKNFGRLFGASYGYATSPERIVGHFNAHLETCIVLFADEAFYAGDKRHEAILKGLISDDDMYLERKGIDVVMADNVLHIIMASNSTWVVPAGAYERRFFIHDVGEDHRQDKPYFRAIAKQLDNGGLAAFLFDLLRYDLSKFDIHEMPDTAAMQEQKTHSLSPMDAWLLDALTNGVFTTAPLADAWLYGNDHDDPEDWEAPIECSRVYRSYVEHARAAGFRYPESSETLGVHLKGMFPGVKRGQKRVAGSKTKPYFYSFPPLSACRKAFNSMFNTRIGDTTVTPHSFKVTSAVYARGAVPFIYQPKAVDLQKPRKPNTRHLM